MSEQTYTGSCHCGAVEYEATVDLDRLVTCNRSICRRQGTVLGFTLPGKFKLLKGEDNLTDYQFGKKNIHHLFCKTCGVKSYAKGTAPDGTEMRAINVRCLDGVDLETLSPKKFDGASL